MKTCPDCGTLEPVINKAVSIGAGLEERFGGSRDGEQSIALMFFDFDDKDNPPQVMVIPPKRAYELAEFIGLLLEEISYKHDENK